MLTSFQSINRRISRKPKGEPVDAPSSSRLSQSTDNIYADAVGLFCLYPRDETKQESEAANTSYSGSLAPQVTEGPCNVDIIAIHGLGGSIYKTWTSDNGRHWLRDFLPNEFPEARIYSFGYDSSFAFSKGTGTLRDFAISLLEAIKLQRTTSGVFTFILTAVVILSLLTLRGRTFDL